MFRPLLPKYIPYRELTLFRWQTNAISCTIQHPGQVMRQCFTTSQPQIQLRKIFFKQILSDVTAIDTLTAFTTTHRFSLVYIFYTLINRDLNIFLQPIRMYEQQCSISSLFTSALVAEREIYDLFGIFFNAHPDLRRLLTDYGFKGYPLRKDFPLTGYIQIAYSVFRKGILFEYLSMVQEFRNFIFLSPWNSLLCLLFLIFFLPLTLARLEYFACCLDQDPYMHQRKTRKNYPGYICQMKNATVIIPFYRFFKTAIAVKYEPDVFTSLCFFLKYAFFIFDCNKLLAKGTNNMCLFFDALKTVNHFQHHFQAHHQKLLIDSALITLTIRDVFYPCYKQILLFLNHLLSAVSQYGCTRSEDETALVSACFAISTELRTIIDAFPTFEPCGTPARVPKFRKITNTFSATLVRKEITRRETVYDRAKDNFFAEYREWIAKA
jgi:NADH:ubiquinone oxidoreductase subunit C